MNQLPEIIALLGLLLSSLVFYIYAYSVNRQNLNMEGFTLSNRTLTDRQFSNTFTASSLSLAIVIIFFISTHELYGLVLLICPITFILGQYLFFYVVRRCKIDFGKYRTISDLIYAVFPSKKIARLITLITVTSFIGIAFIELYVGSVILTFFLPKNALYQTLSFFTLGIIVLLYIRLGGYKAIVKTDKWQLFLMTLSIITILIFSISLPSSTSNKSAINSFMYIGESSWGITSFILWVTLNNLMVSFVQLSFWQRVVASSSLETAISGMKKATWKTLFIWTVPILSFILIRTKGYNINDLENFLAFTRTTSYLSSIILFPIITVGFASALFSSADVAIIAIVHAISDKNTFLKLFENLPYNKFKQYLTILTILILLTLSLVYWIKYLELTNYFVPLIYSSLGQMTMLVPLSCYALWNIRKNITCLYFKDNILFYGIILGWLHVLSGTILSVKYNSAGLQQLMMIFGTLIILLAIKLSLKNPHKELTFNTT